jgi:hypothetical protein
MHVHIDVKRKYQKLHSTCSLCDQRSACQKGTVECSEGKACARESEEVLCIDGIEASRWQRDHARACRTSALSTSDLVQVSSTGIDERAAGDVRARAHVRLHRAAYNKNEWDHKSVPPMNRTD